MSRSYKKNGVLKHKDGYYQKLGNKIFRQKSKTGIREDTELPYNKSEVVEDWNVSDWRYWPKNKRIKK